VRSRGLVRRRAVSTIADLLDLQSALLDTSPASLCGAFLSPPCCVQHKSHRGSVIRSHQIRRANYAGDVCRRTGIFRVRHSEVATTVRLLGRSPAEPRNTLTYVAQTDGVLNLYGAGGEFWTVAWAASAAAATPLQLTPSGRYRVTDLLEGFAPFQKPALTGTANVLATGTAIVPAART
jgi:hypothetical protein